jgi:magnesium transporter
LVGFFNGLGFALLISAVTYLWFGQELLAMVIGTAMILNMVVAGLFGISIPIILDRIGIDPALASSVFLTTVTDVVGFFAFLGLASLFLV